MTAWWPFGAKPFLEPEDETWQIETWAWLLRRLGGRSDLVKSPLVQPNRVFFPPTEATGHARAEHIFALVKLHARMEDWPTELVDQPDRPERKLGPLSVLKTDEGGLPLGTYSHDGRRATITYDPGSLQDPVTLVATLAHELAHFRLAALRELPPGGAEAVEFATDLTTVYLGFGAFGANCAFNFQQFQDGLTQGWQTSRQGYLTERQWAFSLAIFLILRGEPVDTLRPMLKAHLYADLARAYKSLTGRPAVLAGLG